MSYLHYEFTPRNIFSSAVGAAYRVVQKLVCNVTSTVKSRKYTFCTMLVVLLMSSLLSVAQTSGTSSDAVTAPPTVNALGMNSIDVAVMIGKTMDDKLNSLSSSTGLSGARDLILGAGLAIGLFWTALKTMVAGKGIGELLGEWIPILITAGVVTALTATGSGSAGNQIAESMDKIAGVITSAVGGQAVDTSSIQGVIGSAVETTFSSIANVIATPQRSEPTSMLDVAGMLGGLGAFIFRAIMQIATCFIIAISMCVFMATAIMAMVSVKLVIALAPVMVPFLIFKPTAWLFDSWLRFLLGASMLKLVGAFMLALTSGLFSSMKVVGEKIASDAKTGTFDSFTGDIVLFATMLLISVLAGLLMAQVPSIAAGLLAGSAGGAGFSSLRGISQNMGSRAATGTSKATGNFVADKAPMVGREARAFKKGAEDLKAGINTGGKEYGGKRAPIAYARGRARPRSD